MPEFTQLALPGFPVRVILSMHFTVPSEPARVHCQADYPTDYLEQALVMRSVEGRMTIEELLSVGCTLLESVIEATCAQPSSGPIAEHVAGIPGGS
jgi:hypothetical protein